MPVAWCQAAEALVGIDGKAAPGELAVGNAIDTKLHLSGDDIGDGAF